MIESRDMVEKMIDKHNAKREMEHARRRWPLPIGQPTLQLSLPVT